MYKTESRCLTFTVICRTLVIAVSMAYYLLGTVPGQPFQVLSFHPTYSEVSFVSPSLDLELSKDSYYPQFPTAALLPRFSSTPEISFGCRYEDWHILHCGTPAQIGKSLEQ